MKLDENVQVGETAVAPKRGREPRRASIAVGGLPTVSLLPREFETAARARAVRNAFIGAFVVAAVVAGGGTALAGTAATAASDRLAAATERTQVLSRQLTKFRDVQELQNDIAVGRAAVNVGTSTEIDWKAQLDAVRAIMPAGFAITSVTADSASAMDAYPQGTTPLDRPRAATMSITAEGTDVDGVPAWLREIRNMPAYADMTASVVTDDEGKSTVQMTLHLSAKALISSTGKTE